VKLLKLKYNLTSLIEEISHFAKNLLTKIFFIFYIITKPIILKQKLV